jgi:single-stranded DNA-specific DHH superfamily exonuclease
VILKNFYYYKEQLNSIQFFDKFITKPGKVELIKKYEHLKRPKSEEDFGYYLAGLIEGDGYIGKRSIEIAFHINDISLAYYIKKRIGYGNVTKYSHTNNAVRYSV